MASSGHTRPQRIFYGSLVLMVLGVLANDAYRAIADPTGQQLEMAAGSGAMVLLMIGCLWWKVRRPIDLGDERFSAALLAVLSFVAFADRLYLALPALSAGEVYGIVLMGLPFVGAAWLLWNTRSITHREAESASHAQ